MNRLSIIDGDFIIYYCAYNKKDTTPKTLEEIYKVIDIYISYLLRITKSDYYIGYLTLKKTFRNDINKLYKAQRKTSDICFLQESKLYLQEKYQFKIIDGLESDDCCLITENQLKDKYNIDITIISPDKDIRNTEGNRFNPNKNEFIVCTKNQEIEYFWKSMIIGDTADNIKGIPGKGIKYAENVTREFLNGDLDYRTAVFLAYVENLGEYKGIQEFYKNYVSLKILREHEGFNVGENDLIKVKISEFEEKIDKEI